MFRKCLKYDIRSVWHFWRILSICAVGLGFVGSLAVRCIVEICIHLCEPAYDTIRSILNFTLGAVAAASCLGIIAFFIITVILVYVRFYTNFFSDEGYLTFTLPVKRRTLYASKVVNTLIWEGASLIVLLFDVLLAMLIIPSPCSANFIGIAIGPFDVTPFAQMGTWLFLAWKKSGLWLLIFTLEGLLIVVSYLLLSTGLIQLCITLGGIIAKKQKFLVAIGYYCGIQFTLACFVHIVMVMTIMLASPGAFWLVDNMTSMLRLPMIALLLLMVSIVLATVACILHFAALDKLERRLNLA